MLRRTRVYPIFLPALSQKVMEDLPVRAVGYQDHVTSLFLQGNSAQQESIKSFVNLRTGVGNDNIGIPVIINAVKAPRQFHPLPVGQDGVASHHPHAAPPAVRKEVYQKIEADQLHCFINIRLHAALLSSPVMPRHPFAPGAQGGEHRPMIPVNALHTRHAG